jgi:heme/copper-type cytochrome/quinol oxidase subunit 3
MASSVTPLHAAVLPRRPAVPNAILGTIVFVIAEAMYFLALVSSFIVIRSKVYGSWAPPGDVRLPVLATAFNTLVLAASGVLMVLATRSFANPATRERARPLFLQAILLGGFFLAFQGYEWVKLIRYGMTLTSGVFSSLFYVLIGSHGLHVVGAMIAMGLFYAKLANGKLKVDSLRAMSVYWLFVVGVWPILYGLVYFG